MLNFVRFMHTSTRQDELQVQVQVQVGTGTNPSITTGTTISTEKAAGTDRNFQIANIKRPPSKRCH
jgi:hypothetical protein